jgi:hypothetical protein
MPRFSIRIKPGGSIFMANEGVPYLDRMITLVEGFREAVAMEYPRGEQGN